MELQFNKSEIRALRNEARGIRTAELTQETKLPDGMPDIGRVLTSWGQILLRSKEWDRDQIGVSGSLLVQTLCVPEDGTAPRTVETWIPFQLKWDVDEDAREGAIRVLPLLRFVDSRGTSPRKIMVRAGISALGQALSPVTEEVYSPGEVPEDVELLKQSYPVRIPREAGEKTFLMDEELSMPDAAGGAEKLLSFTMRPEVTDQKVLGSRMVFKGNGNLHIVFRDAEGKLGSYDFELPFSQFAELESEFSPDALGDVQMAVTNLEADLMDAGKLRLKAGLVGQYLVDERELLELTEDAYSPFREVEPERTELELPSVLEDRSETVTAEQSIPGQSGQVVDVNFLPDFPRQRRSAQGVELELPALFQTLYYGEDGSLQAANSRWEGQMNIPADEGAELELTVQPGNRPSAMAGADGIDLAGQLRLGIRAMAETELPMVSGLELGEVREPDSGRPSLVLTRAGDEDLWTLAKRSGSTVAAIKRANGLEETPAAGRMLLVPVV